MHSFHAFLMSIRFDISLFHIWSNYWLKNFTKSHQLKKWIDNLEFAGSWSSFVPFAFNWTTGYAKEQIYFGSIKHVGGGYIAKFMYLFDRDEHIKHVGEDNILKILIEINTLHFWAYLLANHNTKWLNSSDASMEMETYETLMGMDGYMIMNIWLMASYETCWQRLMHLSSQLQDASDATTLWQH